MAYYGRRNSPTRPPVYYISGNVARNPYNQGATKGVYTNRAFVGVQTPSYRVTSRQQPVAPRTGLDRNRLMCLVIGFLSVLLLLVLIGTILGIVLGQQPTQALQPTIAPQPHPTQAPQPKPTQAPQPQPTQAPQPQPTQAPQPQPTQAPQPQPTQAPQPQPTEAPQTTQAPQPQPTESPTVIEGDIFNTGICGTRPVLDNRILGGIDADLGDWPWIGALLTNSEQGCGATLLNSRWAVTAAHCVVDPDEPPTSIVFGLTDLTNQGSFSQESGFIRMINHPQYDQNDPAAEYDITLLHLSQTIQFNNYVRPACLATHEQETSVYRNCHVTGWGALSEPPATGFAEYPDILQEVILPLISSSDCQAIDNKVTSNIICAAGTSQGGIDTCQGDSGGPLVCESNRDDVWHLVGVVSTGEGCGRPNVPGFYTRISQFISWIETTVAQYS